MIILRSVIHLAVRHNGETQIAVPELHEEEITPSLAM